MTTEPKSFKDFMLNNFPPVKKKKEEDENRMDEFEEYRKAPFLNKFPFLFPSVKRKLTKKPTIISGGIKG